MRRTKSQWQALIAQYQTSGQTQHDFCTERDINPKYFSALKQRFTSAGVVATPFVKATQPKVSATDNIRLSHNSVTLELPVSLPCDYLATLIKALA